MRDKWMLSNASVTLLMSAHPVRRALPGGEVDFQMRLYTPLAWHGRIDASQLQRAPYLYHGAKAIEGMTAYAAHTPKVLFSPMMHSMLPNCFIHRANAGLAAAHRDILAGRKTAAAQSAANSASALIPPAAGTGKLKLCVVSHGIAGTPDVYWSIINALASAGYAVAAIEHGDLSGSATMTAQHGVITYQPKKAGMTPYRKAQFDRRVWECIAVLDELEELVRVDPAWRGRLDVDRVTAVGHSFGGATAARATAVDRRFAGVCLLDPWMEPLGRDVLDGGLGDKPALLIMSDTFCKWSANLELCERFCSHNRNALFGFSPNSGHQQFTDLSLWAPAVLRLKRQMGSIDHRAFMAHLCRVVVAFARLTFGEAGAQDNALMRSNQFMIVCHPQEIKRIIESGGDPNTSLTPQSVGKNFQSSNTSVNVGRGGGLAGGADLPLSASVRSDDYKHAPGSDWHTPPAQGCVYAHPGGHHHASQVPATYTPRGRVTPPPQPFMTYQRGGYTSSRLSA